MSQRLITLWSTKNSRLEEITTDVKTWGQLKPLVKNAGFDISSLSASEDINNSDLVNEDAKLPEGEFTVFLRPSKTKSGNYGYKDAKAKIVQLIAEHGDHAREHFNNGYAKNYTHMGTADLNTAIAEYTPAPVGKGNVADVVESVAASKSEEATEVQAPREKSLLDHANDAISDLNSICSKTDDEDVCERVDDIVSIIRALIEDLPSDGQAVLEEAQQVESEEDRIAREKQEEEDRIAEEAREAREAKKKMLAEKARKLGY